jgi:exodeoxyribonuclease-1
VTRYSLYRNFFDPYAREWQGGNSRWDLIDVVRAAYALRPEGIVWPKKTGGSRSSSNV